MARDWYGTGGGGRHGERRCDSRDHHRQHARDDDRKRNGGRGYGGGSRRYDSRDRCDGYGREACRGQHQHRDSRVNRGTYDVRSTRDPRDDVRGGGHCSSRGAGKGGYDGRGRDGGDSYRGYRDHHQDRRSRSHRGWSPRGTRADGCGMRDQMNGRDDGRWAVPSRDNDCQRQAHAQGAMSSGKRVVPSGYDGKSRGGAPQPSPDDQGSCTSSLGSSGDDDKSESGSNSDQDEIVHFDWHKGQTLDSRYALTRLLGDGTFGRVVLARDQHSNGREVAIKIIRDVKRYMENAKIEADILKDIRKMDPNGTSGCAILYDTFTYEQRFFCLVFEPLGESLYDFLKANDFRGFWVKDIQSFARQCMQALMFLHDRLHMTHTDLKPENILLCSMAEPRPATFHREQAWLRARGGSTKSRPSQYMRPYNAQIKLIDFGNATYEDEHHSSIINTRQYRGPEVLLALGWDERSDLWSIGCILMELYAGEQLFATHEELEHLALMARVIGPLPPSMLANASQSVKEKYLTLDPRSNMWRLPWPERASSSASHQHVESQLPLVQQVPPEHALLADFTRAILALDPKERPSAAASLKHDFFQRNFQD